MEKIKFNKEKIKESILDFCIDDINIEELKNSELIIYDDDFDINNNDSYIEVKLGSYRETYENNIDLKKYILK